jgi:opacity protein-like surface antigen
VTPFVGQHFGTSFETEEDVGVELSDDTSFGFLVSWDYDPGREGEVLISHSRQDLEISGLGLDQTFATDVTYAHFGGRVWYGLENAIQTSVSGGLGVSYFDSSDDVFDSELKVSAHLGLGAKYQVSEQVAIKADIRVFATFFDSDHSIYCVNGACLVNLQSEIYTQTEIAVGLEYRF